MKEYLIAYRCPNDRISSGVYCGKNMNEATVSLGDVSVVK